MTTYRCVGLIVSAALSFSTGVFAEDCGFLKVDPLSLLDRQVYIQTALGEPWTLLTGVVDGARNQPVKLAYVFREQFRQGHKGVVVIKSGRTRQLNEPQRARDKTVALVREAGSYCKGPASFTGTVLAKSYDDYHDLGRGGEEVAQIKNFHAGYNGRRPFCRSTNDGAIDSLTDLRTNRGQFSFDKKIVSDGTYVQLAQWVGASQAAASSERLEDQRVEIKQYETAPGFPSCVRITLPAQKSAGFVRINDLEGLAFNETAYVRSAEQEWQLTSP